jgi:glycosyltransferase involved in cell wall biosynthesis
MHNIIPQSFRNIRAALTGTNLALFHIFQKPPYGGANQFMLALEKALSDKSQKISRNGYWRGTQAILANSFLFDEKILSRARETHPRIRIVHRLSGPIGIYRGTDIEIDRKTQRLNSMFADATIFISNYSFQKYTDLGLHYKNPVVIQNTVDPHIFHSQGRINLPDHTRKIRLVATAWSDNPKKGGPLLTWLDEHLSQDRFELTFVGRTKAVFKNAKVITAVPSEELATILRNQDVYIAPSEDDPCSNALLEALACGLPAVYRNSGGHPELVGDAGVGFTDNESALAAIETVAQNIGQYRSAIRLPTIQETAQKYLDVLIP